MLDKTTAYGSLRVSVGIIFTRFCHPLISHTTVLLFNLSHPQDHIPTAPRLILLSVPPPKRYLAYSMLSVYPLLSSVSFHAPDLLNPRLVLPPNTTVLHPEAATRTGTNMMVIVSQMLSVERPSRSTLIDLKGTDRPSYPTCLLSRNHSDPRLFLPVLFPYRRRPVVNHRPTHAAINRPLSYVSAPLNLLPSKLGRTTTLLPTDFHHSSPSLRRRLLITICRPFQAAAAARRPVLDVYRKVVKRGGHWNLQDHMGQRLLRKARRRPRKEVRVLSIRQPRPRPWASARARPGAEAVNRGKRWSLSRG